MLRLYGPLGSYIDLTLLYLNDQQDGTSVKHVVIGTWPKGTM